MKIILPVFYSCLPLPKKILFLRNVPLALELTVSTDDLLGASSFIPRSNSFHNASIPRNNRVRPVETALAPPDTARDNVFRKG